MKYRINCSANGVAPWMKGERSYCSLSHILNPHPNIVCNRSAVSVYRPVRPAHCHRSYRTHDIQSLPVRR